MRSTVQDRGASLAGRLGSLRTHLVPTRRDLRELTRFEVPVSPEHAYGHHVGGIQRRADRMFAVILLLEWVAGLLVALLVSPRMEPGTASSNLDVLAAILLGGVLSGLPILLIVRAPGRARTRLAVAISQLLWSLAFIHFGGGRIESHLHIFGSVALLAMLAAYRDGPLIVATSVLMILASLVRGTCWPDSVLGGEGSDRWLWLEHAGWTVVADVFLLMNVRQDLRSLRVVAVQTAELRTANFAIERKVEERTRELVEAHADLTESHDHANELVARLQDERQERQQLLEAINMVLIALDVEGRVKWWNALAERTTGLLASDVVGRSFRELDLHCDVDLLHARVLEMQATTQRVCIDDFAVTLPSGEDRVFEVAISPWHVGDAGAGALLLAGDITDGRALEQQIAQSQKLESIGRLAAGVAHEINTPTQYVGDNTRFLKNAFDDVLRCLAASQKLVDCAIAGPCEPEVVNDVARVFSGADVEFLNLEIPKAIDDTLEGIGRVANIVKSLKEFSHPGTKEKTLTDLNHAIDSTVTVARNEWKYVADVSTELDPDLPLVPCFPGDLNQVFLNMLINAAHAIADAQAQGRPEKGRITIRTRVVDDHVEIDLADSGTGIPEEIRSKIFDQFFTTKSLGLGTGQGLAFVRSIVVNRHGGEIAVASEVGVGTTFTVRLPLEMVTA